MTKKIKVFKTYTFKIHTPSQKKTSLITKSLIQSRYAFFQGLKYAKPLAINLPTKTKQEKKDGIAAIKKTVAEKMKPLPYSNSIKASTIEDVAAQCSSYAELTVLDDRTGYPERLSDDYDYEIALIQLLNSTTKEQEDIARDEMAKIYKSGLRPMSFYKSRASDGFLMLKDLKDRVFVFVNLWAAKDKRAEPVIIKDMINLRTGEVMNFKTSLGLLLPLECSDWHLNALLDGQSKSAKLFLRNDELFLAVAVEHQIDAREPELIMGIDRGIEEIATYAIRQLDGKIIKSGSFSGEVIKEHQRKLENRQKLGQKKGKKIVQGWSNYSDNLMHHIANAIVDVADKYNARVVLEDLSSIKNGSHHRRIKFSRKTNFNRLLSRQQYGKLEFMLTYKLQAVGLPKPRLVRAAYTSLTCPSCGSENKNNRPDRAIFHCVECRYKSHSDINGAVNIAGKLIWLTENKGKDKFSVWQSSNLSL